MQLPPLTKGRILRRYKRFFADIELEDGSEVVAHCANTGSMTGCWEPGAPVQISYNDDPKRKLRWTLERVDMGQGWVGVNTYRPNQVIKQGLEQGQIAALSCYEKVKAEAPYVTTDGEKSRIDFLLQQSGLPDAFVEVKSVTLFDGDRVRFPDAVSSRGLKHLDALADAHNQGYRAIMLYAVNRPEATVFSPAVAIDPRYSERLLEVHDLGVEILVVRLRHKQQAIEIGEELGFVLT